MALSSPGGNKRDRKGGNKIIASGVFCETWLSHIHSYLQFLSLSLLLPSLLHFHLFLSFSFCSLIPSAPFFQIDSEPTIKISFVYRKLLFLIQCLKRVRVFLLSMTPLFSTKSSSQQQFPSFFTQSRFVFLIFFQKTFENSQALVGANLNHLISSLSVSLEETLVHVCQTDLPIGRLEHAGAQLAINEESICWGRIKLE